MYYKRTLVMKLEAAPTVSDFRQSLQHFAVCLAPFLTLVQCHQRCELYNFLFVVVIAAGVAECHDA
ncbi:hypothetical protein PsorP6_008641 [Peronosclerospora sorghi]|uniref:Uncharacterized protein n=1 Tax=Peronosclerospora sorghi TaxID=230839 RepID=A0ACC0W8P7_9STRA|nr:hypothetical protein PsorP6_008641 [Peronosclerospora sorghi]